MLSKTYDIIITSKYPFKFKDRLFFTNFNLRKAEDEYTGKVTESEYKNLQDFCRKNRYKLRLDNNFATRSTDYRQTFFKYNKPHVFHKYYYCTYCGKLLRYKDVTVDHLYPVNASKKSLDLQKRLKRKGLKDINDKKNLVSACEKCNKLKSDNMGKWLKRGAIGRHPIYWKIRHTAELVLICGALYSLHIAFQNLF